MEFSKKVKEEIKKQYSLLTDKPMAGDYYSYDEHSFTRGFELGLSFMIFHYKFKKEIEETGICPRCNEYSTLEEGSCAKCGAID